MEKGLNSDINIKQKSYHVQTEDWGKENPFLVSRIYKDGQVIQTFKTAHSEILAKGPASYEAAVRLALKDQHLKILDLLISGQLSL